MVEKYIFHALALVQYQTFLGTVIIIFKNTVFNLRMRISLPQMWYILMEAWLHKLWRSLYAYQQFVWHRYVSFIAVMSYKRLGISMDITSNSTICSTAWEALKHGIVSLLTICECKLPVRQSDVGRFFMPNIIFGLKKFFGCLNLQIYWRTNAFYTHTNTEKERRIPQMIIESIRKFYKWSRHLLTRDM